MEMETAKKHMSKGYDILRNIFVSDEDVERMAAVKQELRLAYAAIERAQKASEEQNGGE